MVVYDYKSNRESSIEIHAVDELHYKTKFLVFHNNDFADDSAEQYKDDCDGCATGRCNNNNQLYVDTLSREETQFKGVYRVGS